MEVSGRVLERLTFRGSIGGHDKRDSPTLGETRLSHPLLGGTCLSGPPCNVGQSIPLQRVRQACPSDFARRVITNLTHTRLKAQPFVIEFNSALMAISTADQKPLHTDHALIKFVSTD